MLPVELYCADARARPRLSYYATLIHELVHSTGHSSRLDRGLNTALSPFGSAEYSNEELVAEMGASLLNAAAGIDQETSEQSAAYSNGWCKRLSDDKTIVVTSAHAAQWDADWVIERSRRAITNHLCSQRQSRRIFLFRTGHGLQSR
jgi:antirestriction protein ArdC